MPVITKKITYVGDLIREMRKMRGFTQQSLAQKLGIEQTAVSKIESGVIGLSLKNARILCDLLGLPAAHLMNAQRLDDGVVINVVGENPA